MGTPGREFETRGTKFARSFEEIAEELGTTRQGAEHVYNVALKKLRDLVWRSPALRATLVGLLTPERIPRAQGLGRVWTEVLWELAERLPPKAPRDPYQDWSSEGTVVVSGPISEARFPGRRFPTRLAAREYWLARAGRIHHEHSVPGRWIFRVKQGTTDANRSRSSDGT